jgi:SOS-response transcriptional repressor LexA
MTARQAQLLEFIRSYQAAHGGASPSLGEMAAAMGFKSKSAATRVLRLLEAQGRVRRPPGRRARSIEIVNRQPAVEAMKSALAQYDADVSHLGRHDVAVKRFIGAAREILGAA